MSENSDLTVLLHRGTDDLPVFVRGATGLRRAAERGRRRRRVAAATFSTVVAVVVGAAAVLDGAGGGPVAPPPAETPTPAPSGVARGLLAPDDLPTGVPFGAWTGYTDHTDPSSGPFCVAELTAAGVDQWLVRAFETDAADVEGYQAIVRFASVDEAKQAGSTLTHIAICGKSNFGYAADGQGGGRGQNSPALTPGAPVISLTWSRSQQYLSVVSLSWRSAVLLTDPVQDAFWRTVQDRLHRATPDLAAPNATVAEQAMLVAPDVPPGPDPADRVTNLTGTPFTYWPLHSCDFDVADAAPLRQVILGDDHRVLAGERLVLASDEPSAQAMVSDLQNRIRSCDTPSQMQAHDGSRRVDAHETSLPAVGDDAWGWQYDRTMRGGEQDRVYIAILREGPLVAQIVRILPQGDPAPAALAELVTTAAERLAAHADELAQREATGLR